ncbi:MAG: hypothetical protein ACYCTG_06275 [Ferrimicrobium sp.]
MQQGLRPRGARLRLAHSAAAGVAFDVLDRLGTPIALISRLNTWPARAPVNASPSPSRTPTHDSGSSWLAMPSM